MRRCPNCQKEFPDSMRFCQTDGTPLVDAAPAQQEDPFKTVVGQPMADDPFKTVVGGGGSQAAKDDDLLQLPEEPLDPMKTMVVKPEELRKEFESSTPFSEPYLNEPPMKQSDTSMPEPPKFNEPSLNPPVFGDLSPQTPSATGDVLGSSTSASGNQPKSFEPPTDSPFGQPPVNSPFQSPFEQQKSTFEPSSPFDEPKAPPFKEAETPFGGNQPSSPFDNSPFAPQQSPFGNQPVNDPFGSNQPQTDWNPPPAPMQNWQDQGLGANTPFQPPAVTGGGQNQTLAIVSLVSGILGLCCGVLGIVALITGFMAKNNADQNPAEYGGRGLALAGMILGGISVFLMVIGILLNLLGVLGRGF